MLQDEGERIHQLPLFQILNPQESNYIPIYEQEHRTSWWIEKEPEQLWDTHSLLTSPS